MKIVFPFLTATLLAVSSFAQTDRVIDSLETQLKNHDALKMELGKNTPALYDTTAVNILMFLVEAYSFTNIDTAMNYAEQAKVRAEQIGYKSGMADAYNGIGLLLQMKGNPLQSIDILEKAMLIRQELNDTMHIAGLDHNIGSAYYGMGNYPEALRYYLAALKINEEHGNVRWQINNVLNIGMIYETLGNPTEALKKYNEALELNEKIGDKNNLIGVYNNIGSVYQSQGKYDEALQNFLLAKGIAEEMGLHSYAAVMYNNIGIIYQNLGDYSKSLKNSFTAVALNEKFGDNLGIASNYFIIGDTYKKQRKYNEAYDYLRKALTISDSLGSLEDLNRIYLALSDIDSIMGDEKSALTHYKMHIFYRDSMFNEENTKKAVQIQMQYDFDKQQVADSLQFAQEKQVGALMLQRQKAITYTGFAGVLATLLILYLVYNNYKKQRLAHQQLKEAQAQLIKSEKMAAFGVMASRVAHEILNPLNFVNNFSELSQELVTDILTSRDEKEKKESGDILINNLQKINEHGRRASAIIKELQEHSLKGSAHEYFEPQQQE